MPREITVVTPENIPLTLELAGLGSRFGALLVDLLIESVVGFALLVVFFIVLAATSLSFAGALSGWVIAAGIVLFFLIFFGYFIFFETIWNGQTPGKKTFGLRVVRDGGYPINVFSAVARNLVRIADFLPSSYGVGGLVVFFQPEYKRLGDLAAGTLVIKERPTTFSLADPPRPQGVPEPALPPGALHPSDVLTEQERDLLRRFVLRRPQMNPDDAERFAYRLIAPIVSRLNLSFAPGVAPRYADLVALLVAAADAREEF